MQFEVTGKPHVYFVNGQPTTRIGGGAYKDAYSFFDVDGERFVLKVGYVDADLTVWRRANRKVRKFLVPILASGTLGEDDWIIQPFQPSSQNPSLRTDKRICLMLLKACLRGRIADVICNPFNWVVSETGKPLIIDFGMIENKQYIRHFELPDFEELKYALEQ